jgi:hypothetical protein
VDTLSSVRKPPTWPTWPIAAGSLIVGFAVADVTGVRALGGIVLFLAALWCGVRWRREVGLGRALGLVLLYLVAFALSHVLARAIGSWPSVLVLSAIVGAAVWAWADARAVRPRSVRPT